jgi:nucleoside diphosphate kinase
MKRRQLTLGIIKPDILVPSLPLLLQQRPSLTLHSLYANPPHILSSSSSTAHNEVTTSQTPLEEILRMVERNGFEIVRSKLMDMSIEEAERFYGEHEGKFFYQRLVAFMTRFHPSQSSVQSDEMLKNRDLLQIGSGPIIPMILEREDAIAQWRALMGPTHIRRYPALLLLSTYTFNSIYLI